MMGAARLTGRCVAVAMLAFLAPLLIALALIVWRDTRRSPLYRQLRIGLGERPFTLYKLRTMTEDRDARGALLPDCDRLTRVGSLLRRMSLDELPQLWNVARGDMAFVGPRPLLPEYLDRYTPEQRRRHGVPPGITGWAQVNGRNALSWEKRFELDVWYVDHRSPRLDLEILLRTFWSAIRSEGISHQGEATMSAFLGVSAAVETPRPGRVASAAAPSDGC